MRNEEVLLQVNKQRNILHAIRKRKANWIGHILRTNCLLKQVIEGKIKWKIEVTRRQGRSKKLLDDLEDRRGYSHLKEEALDGNMWRDGFERGFERVVRLLDNDEADEKRTLGRPRSRWEGHNDMDCKTIRCDNVDWIHKSQNMDQ